MSECTQKILLKDSSCTDCRQAASAAHQKHCADVVDQERRTGVTEIGTPPPAAKTCQAGASQSRGVRGHQLESHPRPGEPAAQLATGSGMSDFLHGVTAVCTEVSATSRYVQPFSV
ncbi:unnamed protein product [Tetraodon nigroviridis]|uniref:(spotted green pufferfish) hypothetical protein n=1 Tax=Tetraodon nigroviridis TaxID=99883 RepID=Q4RPF6_TETNG|nr:unnamed protein product [Tetraodon nigroviridis]